MKSIDYLENRNGGIYAIINKDNGRVYIGETGDLRGRTKAHVNMLKSGKHYCKDLQNDYNNKSKIEIIELAEIPGQFKNDERRRAEDYYIACLQQKGVRLYNDMRDKNCKGNFFILSSRIDRRIADIIKIANIRK
ncbi:MAG: GIY-YIG nuclease family protein [Roseburia sp.]|nr:GIY-YIG nuclease family protein [Roseburia sp.]